VTISERATKLLLAGILLLAAGWIFVAEFRP